MHLLKEEINAIQAAMVEKQVEFSNQWTTIVKKGAAAPKKVVISETLEEDKRRNSKALNVLVQGMEMGDTPMVVAKKLFTTMGINLTCESASGEWAKQSYPIDH